ncbi:MAG: hypothetical protein ACI915_001406 [Gammaproteobacteria bacterium]|jgi:hypothetical protein
MNNRDILIDIMSEHSLDRRDLGELLHVDRATVDSWLAPGSSARQAQIPDMAIELLDLKLNSKLGRSENTEPPNES